MLIPVISLPEISKGTQSNLYEGNVTKGHFDTVFVFNFSFFGSLEMCCSRNVIDTKC